MSGRFKETLDGDMLIYMPVDPAIRLCLSVAKSNHPMRTSCLQWRIDNNKMFDCEVFTIGDAFSG
jgi:hypothetical protein